MFFGEPLFYITPRRDTRRRDTLCDSVTGGGKPQMDILHKKTFVQGEEKRKPFLVVVAKRRLVVVAEQLAFLPPEDSAANLTSV